MKSSGSLLSASCGTVVKVWDPLCSSNGSYSKPIYFTETFATRPLAWNADASIFAYGGDSGYIRLKNWTNKTSATLSTGKVGQLRSLEFGCDESTLVTGWSDGSVALWNYKSSAVMSTIKETACEITTIATSMHTGERSWHLAFANSSGSLSIYRVVESIASRLGNVSDSSASPTTCLDFYKGNTGNQVLLAAGMHNGYVTIQDALTRYTHYSKDLHQDPVVAVSFASGGDYILSCDSGGNFCLVDVRSSKIDRIQTAVAISSMALHPDSRSIAVGTEDGGIEIRDLRKMSTTIVEEVVHLGTEKRPVQSVKWRPMVGKKKKDSKRNGKETVESTVGFFAKTLSRQVGDSTAEGKHQIDHPFSPLRTSVSKKSTKTTPENTHWNISRRNTIVPETEEANTRTRTSSPVISFKESIRTGAFKSVQNSARTSATTSRRPTNDQLVDVSSHQPRAADALSTRGIAITTVENKEAESSVHLQQRVVINGASSTRDERLQSAPPIDRLAGSTSRAFATPQPKKAENEEDPAPTSASVTYRKRPRKFGSFSEFSGRKCDSPEAMRVDTPAKHDSTEPIQQWKEQYMVDSSFTSKQQSQTRIPLLQRLREDMLEMHFHLTTEIHLQEMEFSRRYEELSKQQRETKRELEELKTLVKRRMNDSIAFI